MADSARGTDETTSSKPAQRRRRGIRFWIVRYLPAEIAGTVAMLAAGAVVASATPHPAAVAAAALIGEVLGFYVVLAVSVALELSRRGGRRIAAGTLLLLVAEFGAAELLDTFFVRPAALIGALWLIPDPIAALVVGKVVADVVFYAVAACGFTLTLRAGLRRRSSDRRDG